jgi:hypothetical protein
MMEVKLKKRILKELVESDRTYNYIFELESKKAVYFFLHFRIKK